jgi:aldose sugar dehydrogenase
MALKKSILFIGFFVVMLNWSCGQDAENKVVVPEDVPFTAALFVDGLQIPWGFAFLPDGSMLITEKAGELLHFSNGKKTKIENVPEVYQRGQGGLLDIALHPDYASNGWLYLSYSSEEGDEKGGHTAILRAKLDKGALVNKELLYKATPNTTKGQHFGSRIIFDQKGYMYFSIGERGDRDVNPQDITRDGGKIYRMWPDGRIPEDNPFVGDAAAKGAIYSYGHRNPQGLALHPETGAVWDHEHGPRGGDEINIIKKGANYGWPVVTYGINYSGTPITDKTDMEGMEPPIHYWVPSIAPSGMAFVTSDAYPGWKGSLLVGSLSFQYLERLEFSGTTVTRREKLMADVGRVRHVAQGPDGLIYVAVEGKGIYKLLPKKG